MELQQVKFGAPTPDTPYYFLKLRLEGSPAVELEVTEIRVNGIRNRDFAAVCDGEKQTPARFRADAGCRELYLRLDWTRGDSFEVAADLKDGAGNTTTLQGVFTADADNGYWDKNWRYYASHVLKETSGYARVQEPVHIVLGLYKDRIRDPEAEIRVVEIDPETGAGHEIRSQVYSTTSWDKWQNINCQPTTTVQVAFLADVPANAQKVFLIFYGNPSAQKPAYPTDLHLSGEGYGLTIENAYYTVKLHRESGSIDEIIPKNRPELVYCHHLETNGALQWNPGIYAPPKTWMHASDWVYPNDFTVIAGPVFIMIKRFNPIVDYEEVDCSLTYIFYSNGPGISIESNIDVTKDLDVVALRNGSVVLNRETTGDFAWMDVDHRLKNVHIMDLPRHPVKGMVFDARTPWFAFYNRKEGNALGVLNLEFSGVRRYGGLLESEPYYYLHWGPWFYVSRPIIYTFTSNNPQRVMHMTSGTSFYERYQLMPFEVKKDGEEYGDFSTLADAYARASEPLSKTAAKFDTDARVPDEWVPPILVSHFEEMED